MQDDKAHEEPATKQEDTELLQGQVLRAALGFRTGEAFRAAVRGNRIPIPLVKLPGRRGWFARASDVARWQDTLSCEFNQTSGGPP